MLVLFNLFLLILFIFLFLHFLAKGCELHTCRKGVILILFIISSRSGSSKVILLLLMVLDWFLKHHSSVAQTNEVYETLVSQEANLILMRMNLLFTLVF